MRVVLSGKWDIGALVVRAVWSGSLLMPSRTLHLDILPGVLVQAGDAVEWMLSGKSLFYGRVFSMQRSLGGVSLDCMDAGVYLAHNRTYKEYVGTPQAIAAQVCGEFGIQAGFLASQRASAVVTSAGELSAYQVIQRAYEGENMGRRYHIGVQDNALFVRELAKEPVCRLEGNILAAHQGESLASMVNRVVILSGAEKVGEVSRTEDREKYGTFQVAYTQRPGLHPQLEAAKCLRGLEETSQVRAVGNPVCITGQCVEVMVPGCGLEGCYPIRGDTHIWTTAGYEMTLLLQREEV